MPRPQKEGLDYFSLDCRFSDRVKLIQAEFGLVGIGILIRLWQKIYGEKGYYTKWDTDVALVFADECRVGVSVVNEVVSACIRRGLFDKNMYDRHGILTSASIQSRFAAATSRRESQEVFEGYLLIPVRKNWVSVDNNSVSVDNNSKNVDDNTQSKVKESKVNKIKDKPNGLSTTTTTNSSLSMARTRENEKPTDLEIMEYFSNRLGDSESTGVEAFRFKQYNEVREWDCLPQWKVAAENWIRNIRS